MESIKSFQKKSGIIFLFLFVVLLLPVVSSAPPLTNVNTNVGYTIYFSQVDFIKQNAEFTLNIYVSNRSDGLIIPNTAVSCYARLFNSTGDITFESRIMTKTSTNRHTLLIKGGNYSDLQDHNMFIWCNSSAFGGDVSITTHVTATGTELTTANSILNLGFLTLLILLFIANLIGYVSIDSENKRNEEGLIVDINNLKYLKGVLFAFGYALLIAVFFTASNIALAYLSSTMFGDVLFVLYRIFMLMALPVVVIWLIWLFVSIFQDKETKNMIERGVQFKGGDI